MRILAAERRYLKGQRSFRDPYRDIAISTLVKIARALKVNISELIEVENIPEEDELP